LQLYAGNRGVITDVQVIGGTPISKLESYLSESILNTFIFEACQSITDRNLTYETGQWVPTYNNWSINPSILGPSSARYTKIGRTVIVQMFAENGVSLANAQILGLPFTSSPVVGSTGSLASNNGSTAVVRLSNNSSAIGSIPALTLTGSLWQLSIIYTI
jgi:hypothetical protein